MARGIAFALLLAPLVARAEPGMLVESKTAPAGSTAQLRIGLNEDAKGIAGLLLTVDLTAHSPDSAPRLRVNDLGAHDLSTAYAGALFGATAPFDPVTHRPLETVRRIGVVQGEAKDGPVSLLDFPLTLSEDAPVGAVYTVTVSAVANDIHGLKLPLAPATATLTAGPMSTLRGDANGNNTLEVADAVLTLRAAAQLVPLSTAAAARADYTRDGQVNVADAVAILRRIAGLPGA